MADSEGLQAPELLPELAVDPLEAQQGFGLHGHGLAGPIKPGLGQLLKAFLKLSHPFRQHGEAAGGRMAAVAQQQISAGLEGLVHGEAARRPHRSPQPSVPFIGQERHWTTAALHQPGGHDANHAMVPMGLGQQHEGRSRSAIGLQQGHRLRLDGAAKLAPLPVQPIALPRQFEGPLRFVGGEQVHHQEWIAQPSHGVDPRGNLEAHGFGIELRILEARQTLQGSQPLQPGSAQAGQAVEQPAPVHPHQGGHVGDGADAEQVESDRFTVLAAHPAAEGAGQHMGQAHAGQAPEGGIQRGDGRMEQG